MTDERNFDVEPETDEELAVDTSYVHENEDDTAYSDSNIVVQKKTVVQHIQSGYKGLTAFILSLGGFLTLVISDEQIREALPDNVLSWLIVAGVPAIIGLGTWLKRNQYTVDEAVKILNDAQKRART